MARLDKIKRKMVRQAVQENVDLVTGRLPRRPHSRLPVQRLVFLAVVPLALLASAFAVAAGFVPARLERQPQATLTTVPPGGLSSEIAPPAAASPQATAPAVADLQAPGIDPTVFPLAVRTVAIDAGHGGEHHGTSHPSGLLEKEITLDVAQRLSRLLRDSGFAVKMIRGDDATIPLEERARAANDAGADIFVSIHVNWIVDPGVRGVETYYLGPTDDPFLTRLAAKENQESGYSLADIRQLLDRIYHGVREGKSRDLAQSIQTALYQSLRKVNPALTDRGVKSAPFIVLVETEMPAVLAEVACLSNEQEADLLTKPLYRQYIAAALAKGVRAYAGSSALPGPVPPAEQIAERGS